MSIYRVKADIKKYQAFYLIDDDENINLQVEGYFDFKGVPKIGEWKGARVYLDATYDNTKHELPIADVTKFNVQALAYSEKAVKVLREILEESGELLPFECDGKKWWIHHITNVVDALDPESTTMELMESGRFLIGKAALDESKLSGTCMFKTKQRMGLILGHNVPENDYQTLVETSGLTGVLFSKK
ncbi:hypothetical protein HQQ94_20990 [Shewanella sp. VB17]|uniref:hypothetical protein n=1 Tax=Shewanella sp. VB17 TaxID=2739432 RepID=UPI0015638D92|nr:hypothetical protein [Shewanella sp. VB17]NRD75651.1 hypothetical protein [Shewanella sp. VB17]